MLVGASLCLNVISTSDQEITCETPSGYGEVNEIIVTVTGQSSKFVINGSNAYFAYNRT